MISRIFRGECIALTLIIMPLKVFQGEHHADFLIERGEPAALLIHGFPGTPAEMRPLAPLLNVSRLDDTRPLAARLRRADRFALSAHSARMDRRGG